jgi:hypothetical protein
MDIVRAAQLVRRRWQAVAAGLVVTVIGVAVVTQMPPKYQAKAVVVLLAPSTTTAGTGPTPEPVRVNPYRVFDDSLRITAEVLSTQLAQPEVVTALVARGASPHFSVEVDPSGGPTVTITADSPDAGRAIETVALVRTELAAKLASRQTSAGAPPGALISVADVITPTSASKLVSGRVRALVATIGLGIVGSLCLALLTDVILAERDKRRARREDLTAHGDGRAGAGPPRVLLADREDEARDDPVIVEAPVRRGAGR